MMARSCKVSSSVVAFLAASLLLGGPANAVETVCAVDRTLSTADFEDGGGQTSNVDTIAKTIRVRAEGGAAGSENSARGELGFRFRSSETMAARVRIGGIVAQGRLEGFGNINAGSIKIRAVLRDLTNAQELANVVVLDKSQNGSFGTKVIEPVNELFLSQPELAVTLTAGHDYVALVRVDVVANGLIGLSDFHNGAGKVTVGSTMILPDLADQDGDGLLDVWEQSGVDPDCDPANGVAVNLPAMGANPNHKDLFLEVDWLPGAELTRASVQAIKEAFGRAPKDSGGIANPDGKDGINLWVDAGDLIDKTAAEDGSPASSCNDGIDNGGDGLMDASDPDCLVGDIAFSSLVGGANLGDGRALPAANVSDLGTDSDVDGVTEFYEARNGNFRPDRRVAFRYAISGPKVGTLLGEAEQYGNDLVFFKPPESSDCSSDNGLFPVGTHVAGLMHELGHTLGLRHGGDSDEPQREPNHISVMNYAHGLGIQQTDNATSQDFNLDGTKDCRIFDYSPPRRPAGRGAAPLPPLDEQALDETKRLDPTDLANFGKRFDPVLSQWITMRLDQRVNWDGDNTPNEPSSTANINNDKDGTGAAILSTLKGFDEWKNLKLSLRGIEDSDKGPRNNLEATAEKDDADEILQIYRQSSGTDLEIGKSVLSSFLVAGQPLAYRVTVTNKGPNRSLGARVIDDLPVQASLLDVPANCAKNDPAKLACEIGALDPGQKATIDIALRLPVELRCKGSQFMQIVNRAMVEGQSGDPHSGNNSTTVESSVLCVAYEYSAKFTCGEPAPGSGDPIGSGLYRTSINIHNPNDETVHFFKNLAFAYPPPDQRAGEVRPLSVDALDYDQALKTSCAEIQKQTAGSTGSSFVEGYLVIQSPRSLDVTGVYTETTPQTSLHVEQIRERKRTTLEEPPPGGGAGRADLVPSAAECLQIPGSAQRTLRVTIRNQGAAPAQASEMVGDLGSPGKVTAPVPSLAAGAEASVATALPTLCSVHCRFDVKVDSANVVDEENELNNNKSGVCGQVPPG
jgi:uncharacterized repeat protein (TIGR01451 family)